MIRQQVNRKGSLRRPFTASNTPRPRRSQIESGLPIRKGAHDACAPPDLAQDPLQLAGGLSALAVGGDVNAAIMTGGNAAEYNSLGLLRLATRVVMKLGQHAATGKAITALDVMDALGSVGDVVNTFGDANATATDKTIATVMAIIEIGGVPLPANVERYIKDALKKVACSKGTCGIPNESCFIAGTPVWTRDGMKPIEEIKIGDIVLSRDEAGQQTRFSRVERVYKRQSQVLNLALQDASGNVETLGTTLEHPFHVPGRGFVAAGELEPGMLVSTASQWGHPELQTVSRDNDTSGFLLVKSLTLEDSPSTVYNFSVEGTHTYFVGKTQAWVHNTCFNFENFTFIHPRSSLSQADYNSLMNKSEEWLINDLLNSPTEPLLVDAAGKVWNGNTRLTVLIDKGYDIRNLIPLLTERNRKP